MTITLNYYQYRYIDVFCSLLAPAALTKKRISKETPTVIVLSQLFAIIEYSSGELSLCHYFSALKSKKKTTFIFRSLKGYEKSANIIREVDNMPSGQGRENYQIKAIKVGVPDISTLREQSLNGG